MGFFAKPDPDKAAESTAEKFANNTPPDQLKTAVMATLREVVCNSKEPTLEAVQRMKGNLADALSLMTKADGTKVYPTPEAQSNAAGKLYEKIGHDASQYKEMSVFSPTQPSNNLLFAVRAAVITVRNMEVGGQVETYCAKKSESPGAPAPTRGDRER